MIRVRNPEIIVMRPIIVGAEDKEEFEALVREFESVGSRIEALSERDDAVEDEIVALTTRQIHLRSRLESYRDRRR